MTNRFTAPSEAKNAVYMRGWWRKKLVMQERYAREAAKRERSISIHFDTVEADRAARENRKVSDGLLHRLHKFHGSRIAGVTQPATLPADRLSAPNTDPRAPRRSDLSAGTLPGGQG